MLDTTQIMQILPHRYPFLMLDRVAKIEGNHLTAVKNITINEPYFQGHFPGHPPHAGRAATGGGRASRRNSHAAPGGPTLGHSLISWPRRKRNGASRCLPGDVLFIEVELTKSRGKIGKAKGVCKVRDEIVSEAEVTFILRSIA